MDGPWRSRIRLVVQRRGSVLTVGGELPAAEAAERVWHADAPSVVAPFAPGLDPVLLRLLRAEEDADRQLLTITLLAALRGAEPAGAEWVDPATLPEVAALLAAAGPAREPWADPEWFPAAAAWLESAVDGSGAAVAGPVVQHKVWQLSCVLRVPTTAGDVYSKATVDSPLFVAEAAVTALLARLFPAHVPAPLAVDRDRGWIATPDFGEVVGWTATVPVRQEALRQYAALQHAATAHVPELLAAGCVDRRPAWLAGQLPVWFAPETTGRWAPPELATALAAAVPRLAELCGELAASPLPDTLLHGDMHMANVARRPGGGFYFFDWTDAGIGHPFVDMIAIVQEDDEAGRAELRSAYLAEWAGAAGRADLDRTWAVAEVLAHVNQAISYMSLGLSLRPDPGAGPHSLFASYTQRWLRTVLGAIDRLDGTDRAGTG